MTRSPRALIRTTALVVACWLLLPPGVSAAADRVFRVGAPLIQALRQLERDGLALVYSSHVITPDLKILGPVTAGNPRAQLDELLRPHGLAATQGPGRVLIVVEKSSAPKPSPQAPVEDGQPTRLTLRDEILVEPSSLSLIGDDPPPPLTLGTSEIGNLAKLADDVFRALDVLPGVATGDVSAELHIRGARRDEMLVLLDGQELYSPYHLREFDNPLSIIDSSALDRVSLLSGVFPVNYGDRTAGVLDMTTRPASIDRRVTVSASLIGAQLEASDTHMNGRLGWLVSGRRGSTDLIGRALDAEDPRFWDLFGKAGFDFTPTQTVRAHLLLARDSLHYADPDQVRRIDSDHDSSYLWLSHQSVLSSNLYFNTIVTSSMLDQRRAGFEDDALRAYDVRDDRRFEALGVTQSWGWQSGDRNFLSFGFEFQRLESRYDYASSFESSGRLGELERSFTLNDQYRSDNASVYLSDRFHPIDNLTLELGLRYDSRTAGDADTLSPRISAAWAATPSDVLRIAWGRYSQSHRPYELMVEDNDATFYTAEESEQWGLGYERTFSRTGWFPLQSIRTEVYLRHSSNPRPRYENLFAGYHPFPEGEPFRVRVEPESATARGVEILLRGRGTSRWNWWINYALADTNDRLDGEQVQRRVDQTHSLNADMTFRPSPRWSVNLAWLYHTGWPVTDVVLDEVDGELVPIVGSRNGTRLKDYNRVDLRVSRDFHARGGTLTLFVDAQNLLNNRNEAGIELRIGNESGDLEIRKERWPGLLASGGFIWRFGRVTGD